MPNPDEQLPGTVVQREPQISVEESEVPILTCPNCFWRFPAEQLLFISNTTTLVFDHRLRANVPLRFVPTRFTSDGDAIDPGGMPCRETACPHCHLKVPRLLTRRRTFSISTITLSRSGPRSSPFTAMANCFCKLDQSMGLRLQDIDMDGNQILRYFEALKQPRHDTRGMPLEAPLEYYSGVYFHDHDGAATMLSKPCLFHLDPLSNHPGYAYRNKIARVACLYSNYSEEFEEFINPLGMSTVRHITDACGLIFVFDPTQLVQIAALLRRDSEPQWRSKDRNRLEMVYGHVINKISQLRGLQSTERLNVPIVVAVTNFAKWRPLLGPTELPSVYSDIDENSVRFLDTGVVQTISKACRGMLMQHAPEIIGMFESHCRAKDILYVPMSEQTNELESTTMSWRTISPIWAEVPLLTLIAKMEPELLPCTNVPEAVAEPPCERSVAGEASGATPSEL